MKNQRNTKKKRRKRKKVRRRRRKQKRMIPLLQARYVQCLSFEYSMTVHVLTVKLNYNGSARDD